MTCSELPQVRNTAKASTRAAHHEAHGRPVLTGPCRASIILMMTQLKAQVWGYLAQDKPSPGHSLPSTRGQSLSAR